MLLTQESAISQARRVMWLYLGTGLALIGVLVLVGLIMRLEQAGWLTFDAAWFYALLTLHGIGMLVAILLCGMGGLWYVLHDDLELDIRVPYVVYGLFLAGTVLVLQSTLVGKFDAAWTTLYPLQFVNPTWPNWATGEFLIALTLVTIGWTAWCLQILSGLLRRYGSWRSCMGWDLVFHPDEFKASGRSAPPPQAFAALAVSVDGLAAATASSMVGVAVLVHWLDPRVAIDPLWFKNLNYLFGHTIANLTIYLLVGVVYVALPHYTQRPWVTKPLLAIAWWSSTVFILTAFFHHLYMDFAQFVPLHFVGHIASYLAAIPVTAASILGALLQVYRSPMRWTMGSIFLYSGMAWWTWGGLGAILDSTVPLNFRFHNTLWVPAHFHGYMLGGTLFFALGWVFMLLEQQTAERTSRLAKWIVNGLISGGILLFLVPLYLAGAAGMPRRYALYPPGLRLAQFSAVGGVLIAIGLVICGIEVVRLWRSSRAEVARNLSQSSGGLS
jgi:cytochrome c oxidase subunit I